MKRVFHIAAIAILSLAIASSRLTAQQTVQLDRAQNQAQGDPDDAGGAPDHGVARLSLMNGAVSVAHGDGGEMTSAVVNAPLVATDRVMTAENSRAEVQFDAINMVRLAPMTEIRLGELQYKNYLIQIAQGTVTFRVFRDSDAQVEISTPNSSIRPRRQGTYRVTVHGDGTSEVTVRSGEAEIFSPTGSEVLSGGTTMMSRGPASDPEFRTVAAVPNDDWDRWNAERDRVFERTILDRNSEISRNVSPDIYGAEELSNYGRWAWDPAYGYVWVPDVPPDWAPYRYGRWSYIDYYGWSWVSYDPWGWAPYHYGRWYRAGFGWAWYPGPVAARYYWRPALVGFFGWGTPGFGVSFGFNFGNIGWVPLAPREPFHPWYGRGFYGNRVTIVNNTNIVNVYHNARYTGAVTGVRAGDFGRGPINNRNFIRPSGGDLAGAGAVRGPMPFNPTRDSRQFGTGNINARGFPQPSNNIRFFSSQNAGGGAGSAAQFQGGGWRRINNFGRSGPNGGAPGNVGGPSNVRNLADGPSAQRLDRGPRGTFNNGFIGSNQQQLQQPVRINPPIVSDRQTRGGSQNGGAGFRDGGDRSPGRTTFGTDGFRVFGDPRQPSYSGGNEPGRQFGNGGFRTTPPSGLNGEGYRSAPRSNRGFSGGNGGFGNPGLRRGQGGQIGFSGGGPGGSGHSGAGGGNGGGGGNRGGGGGQHGGGGGGRGR
jgi:hypothetical protein